MSSEVRQGSGTQPAQYIRLTTAQAMAAGILPAVGNHGETSTQQHFQLAGNKVSTIHTLEMTNNFITSFRMQIQLVRVVNPSTGNNGSGNLVPVSGTSKVIIGSSSGTSFKVCYTQILDSFHLRI